MQDPPSKEKNPHATDDNQTFSIEVRRPLLLCLPLAFID
jgi:hypothetical protein